MEFHVPVDDIIFTLNSMAKAMASMSAANPVLDWDEELNQQIIEAFATFSENVIAPLNASGDEEGCQLVDGRVVMPAGFTRAYQDYVEQGWPLMAAPAEYDGQDLPAPILGAVSEIFSGANHSMQMVLGLVPGAMRTLMRFGTDEQQTKWMPRLASGDYLATMCLTEPQAGSDLSQVRMRATQTNTGWSLNGEKIFISGGDQDLSKGIFHLVLARTGEVSDGTRGLSLFLAGSEAQSGQRNAISVARIEKKMGLHASPTCQLAFDNAEAELIGQPGRGLQAMFTMMNHARIDVALQGVAHTARAADISRRYAIERIQGGKAIADHPEIRQLLDEQRALALGGRAMCQYTLFALESEAQAELVEFLTPVCKIFCTEAGIYAANQSIQILGGYGYLTEYACEQTFRDARITAIYEGTNQIHAKTLASRLVKVKEGASAEAFYQFLLSGFFDEAGLKLIERWNSWRLRLQTTEQVGAEAWAFGQLSGLLMYQRVWQVLLSHAESEASADLEGVYQQSLSADFLRRHV